MKKILKLHTLRTKSTRNLVADWSTMSSGCNSVTSNEWSTISSGCTKDQKALT
ncbi:hypothetical protein [Deinococcus aquaedulcis]|uniref:hypothetical protein n=1 Tax=Deinococcus aquaedulcis TaxID=2840455 RepID=UPI001C82DC3F|nr:hypothetical protein [Deinococcus aquaedulcis]